MMPGAVVRITPHAPGLKMHTEKGTVSNISALKTGGVSRYVWEGGVTDPHSDCWGEGGE